MQAVAGSNEEAAQAADPGEKAEGGTDWQKALRVVEGAVFDETAAEAVLALARSGVQSPARGRDRECQRQDKRPAPGPTSRGEMGATLGGPRIEGPNRSGRAGRRETAVIVCHAEARSSSSNEASARLVREPGNRAVRRVLVGVVGCRSWGEASSSGATRVARHVTPRGDSLQRRSIVDERGSYRGR